MSAMLPNPLSRSPDSSPTGAGVATTRGVCRVTSQMKSSGPSWGSLQGRVKAMGFEKPHPGMCWHPAVADPAWSCRPPPDTCPVLSQQRWPGTGPPVCWEGALIPATSPGCDSSRSGRARSRETDCRGESFGVAGVKAAQLSVVPLWAEPALRPHSPETDKSYRKRGDLSLGLVWLVSARQGEQ